MSVTVPEPELVFYARLDNFEGLKEAELIENHIQMESTFITGPRGRVRKVTPIKGGPTGAADRYEFTMKVKAPPVEGVPSSDESTVAIDRNMFTQFSYAAVRGMNKDRHRFVGKTPSVEGATENTPIPPFTYEVDVFYTKNREYSAYVKIDVEVHAIVEALRTQNLPIPDLKSQITFEDLGLALSDVFYGDDQTPEQGALLDKLWQDEWITPMNPEIYKKPEPIDPPTEGVPGEGEGALVPDLEAEDPNAPPPEQAAPTDAPVEGEPAQTPPEGTPQEKPAEETNPAPESPAEGEEPKPKENEEPVTTPPKPEGEGDE